MYILPFMGHEFTDIHDCTCNNLRKAARAVTQYYDDALRPSGIRATQFSLLSAIKEFGTVSIGALAEESVMDRTTLTRNLKLLKMVQEQQAKGAPVPTKPSIVYLGLIAAAMLTVLILAVLGLVTALAWIIKRPLF